MPGTHSLSKSHLCFCLVAIQLFVLQPSQVQPEVSNWEVKAEGWPPGNSLSNACFCLTESEGDAPNHPAEGSLHPHCRRWGSWVLDVRDSSKVVVG